MKTVRYGRIKIAVAIVFCFASIVAMTAHPVQAQTEKFDGTYAGTETLTEHGPVTNYSQCLKGPFKRRLVVKAGTATYTFNPTYQGQVVGTVNADGDVSGSTSEPTGGVAISGKIEGDAFTGEVWSLYCTYSRATGSGFHDRTLRQARFVA